MAKKLSIHLRKARAFINVLNRLAEDLHGEFGFATLSNEEQMEVMAAAFKEQSDTIKLLQKQAKKKSPERVFKSSPKHKEFWDKH